jgi:hypothetical protein
MGQNVGLRGVNRFLKAMEDAQPRSRAVLDHDASHVVCGRCGRRLCTQVRWSRTWIAPDGAWGRRPDGVWDEPRYFREHGRYRRPQRDAHGQLVQRVVPRKIPLPALLVCRGCGGMILVDGAELFQQLAQVVHKRHHPT